jgi:phosphoenolpyruvate carboxylase
VHVLEALADRTYYVGRNLTLDARFTKPSDALVNLWNHQVEMSEVLSQRALEGLHLRAAPRRHDRHL